MRQSKPYLLLFLVVCFIAGGCDENLDLPPEPAVAFESLVWQQGEGGADSLVLTFAFADGDGNLGLADDEIDAPYHPFDLIVDDRDELVTISSDVSPPLYTLNPEGSRLLYAEEDVRSPFNAIDYLLVDSTGAEMANAASDTLFIHRNIFHHNLYLRCFRKIDGRYVPFAEIGDMEGLVTGRFSQVETELKEPPPVGKIQFTFAAHNFLRVIRADTLKLQFYIFDRDLNQSNLATSPDLTAVNVVSVLE